VTDKNFFPNCTHQILDFFKEHDYDSSQNYDCNDQKIRSTSIVERYLYA